MENKTAHTGICDTQKTQIYKTFSMCDNTTDALLQKHVNLGEKL